MRLRVFLPTVDGLSNSRNAAPNKVPIECIPMSALRLRDLFSTRLFCVVLILASTSPYRLMAGKLPPPFPAFECVAHSGSLLVDFTSGKAYGHAGLADCRCRRRAFRFGIVARKQDPDELTGSAGRKTHGL